jgi:hypothetical protein
MANRANRYIKRVREEERLRRGGYCQNNSCSFNDFYLTFAHLRPNSVRGEGRGRKERIFHVINNPHEYAMLCWECHMGFDHRGDELVLCIRREATHE